LRHSSLWLAAAIFGLVLTYVAPVALLFGHRRALIALATCIFMFVSYAPIIRFYRLNVFWALTLPLAAIFYLIATIDSAVRYWSGAGGEWKGRAQDGKPGISVPSSPRG
jgi:hypothetical protein